MAQPTHRRSTEPLVSKNQFLQKNYVRQSVPVFAEIKHQLPEPVLPDWPEWLEMYWRAWEMVWRHWRRPTPDSKLVSNYLTPTKEDNLFMWDSAFHVQFGLYGRRHCDFTSQLDNFYALQHQDGYICREIDGAGREYFPPFDPNGTGPNIFAWAEWRLYRATGDEERLAAVFWPLLALHRWYHAYRTWPDGLYWATGISSGMDNQPRVPDSRLHHQHWSWVDASAQACLNCHTLEQMAVSLSQTELAAELAEERAHIVQLFNEKMWNEGVNFYQDVSPNGRFSKVKSIGAYWALLDKDLVPDARKGPFVQHLRDQWAFKLPHRIPSQSADSEGYNASTGHSWRGGVWSATNYMTLKGLRAIKQYDLAHEIAFNHVTNVCEAFIRTDTFWENYAPETAVPGEPARPDYVGWTGLTPIAILLEDVIGLSVDWPLRRVTWDKRLKTNGRYGVRNYPLGEKGTLTILGDQEQVTIETDVSFTLTIRDEEQHLQTAVPAGETQIEL
jgi:hypothetical protein